MGLNMRSRDPPPRPGHGVAYNDAMPRGDVKAISRKILNDAKQQESDVCLFLSLFPDPGYRRGNGAGDAVTTRPSLLSRQPARCISSLGGNPFRLSQVSLPSLGLRNPVARQGWLISHERCIAHAFRNTGRVPQSRTSYRTRAP